jgi:ubiquinone/menaquinone biosynthesis C-methylase UbiE
MVQLKVGEHKVAASAQTINRWPRSKCAKAFWGQQELPPYRKLLADTTAWCEPRPGQTWLDLGCGCGQLTSALWTKGQGRLAGIVGMDVAGVNAEAYSRLRQTVLPLAGPEQMTFQQGDFSNGLDRFHAEHFDGVVSGLAIQYAESFDERTGAWTKDAYDHLLREIERVLKPGGVLVFSVNVPEPAWGRVAMASLTGLLQTGRIHRYVKNALRMWHYGKWLTRESRQGRFHFLPVEEIVRRLEEAGFSGIEHRLSYCEQAWVVRCKKA